MDDIKLSGFDIETCDNISKQTNLTKLEISSAQKIHTSALFQQLPSMIAANTMANAYVMHLPAGIGLSNLILLKLICFLICGGIKMTYRLKNSIANLLLLC